MRASVVDEALWKLANELRDVLPLDKLTEEEGNELVSHMRVRRFADGEVVYHRGDPPGDPFVVHTGELKAVLDDEHGRELIVGRYRRGVFFGTVGLVEPTPRENTVVALGRTIALQVERATALHVMELNPHAMHVVLKHEHETIVKLSEQYQARAFLDVRGRLARHLLELKGLGDVRVRQEDIAAAIDANPRTVNKILAELERRGLINVERRRVTILDEPALRREIRP